MHFLFENADGSDGPAGEALAERTTGSELAIGNCSPDSERLAGSERPVEDFRADSEQLVGTERPVGDGSSDSQWLAGSERPVRDCPADSDAPSNTDAAVARSSEADVPSPTHASITDHFSGADLSAHVDPPVEHRQLDSDHPSTPGPPTAHHAPGSDPPAGLDPTSSDHRTGSEGPVAARSPGADPANGSHGVESGRSAGRSAGRSDARGGVWRVRTIEFAVPVVLADASLEDLRASVRNLKAAQGALDAASLQVNGEIARRQTTERGVNVIEVLKAEGGLSGTAAKRQSILAKEAKHLPNAVDHLADGNLTQGHLHQLLRAQQAHPNAFESEQDELTKAGSDTSIDLFTRKISNWIVAHDPDDGSARFRAQHDRRRVNFHHNKDGTISLTGIFDPETGSTIEGAVTGIANDLFNAESRRQRPASTVAQRHADALAHLITNRPQPNASSETIQGSPAGKVLLHVRCDLDVLTGDLERASRRGVHVSQTSTGVPLSAATVRRLACDAGIIPTVMGGKSLVLDVGRMRRTATSAQRSALEHRDGHCVFPGCDLPSNWCQAHHLQPWSKAGPTDLANLALVCSAHHHMIHEGGWNLTHRDHQWHAAPPDQPGPSP